MIKVKVLRILNGGEYMPGDIRDNLSKADAKRLAATGAVEILEEDDAPDAPEPLPTPEQKAEPAPENKMATVPENKAVTTPKKRGK